MTKKEMKKKFIDRIEIEWENHIHWLGQSYNTMEYSEEQRQTFRRCAMNAKEEVITCIKLMYVDFRLINTKEMQEMHKKYL